MNTDLKTISRFAQLEYKYGDPERGRTLFEGIIDSHPKRWDLWSIYMDMEGVQKNIQGLRYALSKPFVYTNYIFGRNLFERVLTLHMTSHKAKCAIRHLCSAISNATFLVDHSSRSGLSLRNE